MIILFFTCLTLHLSKYLYLCPLTSSWCWWKLWNQRQLHTRCSPSRFFYWCLVNAIPFFNPAPSAFITISPAFYFYAVCDSSGVAHPPKPSGICKLSPHPSPSHCKLFACTPLCCHDDGAAPGWAAGVPVWVSGFLIFTLMEYSAARRLCELLACLFI